LYLYDAKLESKNLQELGFYKLHMLPYIKETKLYNNLRTVEIKPKNLYGV
jgi:hypothetical protein